MLEKWKQSREDLDFDTYIAFYADDFYSSDSGGQDYQDWYSSKVGIYQTTDPPSITLSDTQIDVEPDGLNATVTFNQDYYSETTNDSGLKEMSLRRESVATADWLIVREDFTAY